MSVRRLAKDQPASFDWTPESLTKAQWWIAKYPAERSQSAVIPLLWLVQKQEGWVSEPAMRLIGAMLGGMPYIRVYEVATFFTMFHLQPVGKHHLQVCGTTPCALRGANDLKDACTTRFGAQFNVTPDGLFSWEEVECLGACVNAPVVAIHDYYHEDLDVAALEGLIERLTMGEDIAPGSASGRFTSAPSGGPKVLLDGALYDGSLGKPMTLPNMPEPTPA